MVDRSGYFQVAFLVDDIDRAMDAWVAEGVGPFYVQREPKLDTVLHRGARADFRFSVAYAQSGGLQIELISQQGDEPSYYRDVFAPGESGFHHICRFNPGRQLPRATGGGRNLTGLA